MVQARWETFNLALRAIFPVATQPAMQEHNPYSTPSADLSGRDSFNSEQGVTQGVVEQLAKTKGWTRFLGVLSMLLGGLLIIGAMGGSAAIGMLERTGGPFAGMGHFVAIALALYLILGGLYLVAGLKLSGFSSAVTRLIYSGKQRDLEDALDRQRSFWLFTGILCIILAVVTVFGIVGGFVGDDGGDAENIELPTR
jgi:hypothetical protein